MMKRILLLPLLAFCVPLAALAQAPAAQAPAAQGFDAYRIIRLRNIFDPNRTGANEAAGQSAPTPPPTAAAPPKASDFVALTGVMVTSGTTSLAFFSGSRPDYDKVLPVDQEIAGAKIAKITPAGIEISRAGRTIVVNVGQTVPFDNSAPAAAPSTADAAPAGPPGATLSTSSTNASLNAIMRRMMERRQQELK
ncbi:MAG TPA: hypothetical protein VHY22_02805 [Chthoniobacteraceae bacterium]|jgi:hypothetical protein|nr:hypothetical protein [Chthoniobacteraceae bacterium]